MNTNLHYYEVGLEPTPAQAEELMDLANVGKALGDPGLVCPAAPGSVFVQGVTGPVQLSRNWTEQLPPWAQEVLGREYNPPLPPTLGITDLRDARRVNWSSIRREPYGWTLDFAFSWAAFAPWQLMRSGRRVDTGEGEEEDDPLLRRLLG